MLELEAENARMDKNSFYYLLGAAALTILIWQLPGGNFILYPFTVLAVWFHEMAHGLSALLLGGNFLKLEIYSDGSGVAFYRGPLFLGTFGKAIVAFSGALGPPIAGALMIVGSANYKSSYYSLMLLGALLLLSSLIWVRSIFGIIVIPAIGVTLILIAMKTSEKTCRFAAQFLGVQACISTFNQVNYLFSYSAGSLGLSDTGVIQNLLFLPYWFWGALIVICSTVILLSSLKVAYRSV